MQDSASAWRWRIGTWGHILEFLIHITDPCAIDWQRPNDAAIKALLSQ